MFEVFLLIVFFCMNVFSFDGMVYVVEFVSGLFWFCVCGIINVKYREILIELGVEFI